MKRFLKRHYEFILKLIRKKLNIIPRYIYLSNVLCKKQLIFPKETFFMPKLKDIFDNENQYFIEYETEIPEFYVIELPNAYTFINNEEVWTQNHEIILDHTTQKINPKKNEFINFGKAKKIKGQVVQLSLSGLENNYYHWLTECLGRLYLLKKAGITPDYYIVNNNLEFQKQWLKLFGISNKQILTPTTHTHKKYNNRYLIQADCLIITTFINNWIPIQFVNDFVSFQKLWLPSWIGKQYKKIIDKIDSDSFYNIYITRRNAKYRKVINENELIPILQKHGFDIIDLDLIPVIEQINIFKKAKMIIGIHGAGLTNMFFCKEGAKILEIYPSNYFDSSFRLQAINLEIDYTYLIGDEVNENVNPQQANIYLNKYIFEKAISKFKSL